ncbi:MAG: CHASE2 domain-containing protein [Candidatus Omnitrophica bacterium]|nr:CHASE2 domain-containing protein [Candidatus Omnitrophota bacterium]
MFKISIPKKTFKLLIAAVVIALIILASYFRIFETFELATLDLRFKHRPPQRLTDKVVIIEIAQDTLDQIGEWPIDRAFYASLIDILKAHGAKAVVFDVLFSQPAPSDNALIDSAKKSNITYMAKAFRMFKTDRKGGFPVEEADEDEPPIGPFPALRDACRGVGHINVTTDIDGKRRRVPLFIDYKGELIPQLSFLTLCDYLGIPLSDIKVERSRYIQMRPDLRIPIDYYGKTLINFAGRWGQVVPHYSFIEILKSYVALQKGRDPSLDLNQLRGKICLVGLTAVATHDLNPIPLQERYPMIGLHANLLNTILTKSFIVRASESANIMILILLSALVALVVLRFRPAIGTLSAAGISFAFMLTAFIIFGYFGIWVDLFYPLLVIFGVYIFCTFCRYIAERNKRLLVEKELDIAKRIQRSFLKEDPPQIPGLDIAVAMTPARAVGGDLYDFIEIEKNLLGIMVGDVSGKGMPAALFMAKAISDFRFHAKTEKEPVKVVTELNDQISVESSSGLFVTLSYMMVDMDSKKLKIVDAGHLPVIYAGADKETSLITSTSGMAVGIMDGVEFGESEVSMVPGDVFVLYTDGVTEARNTRKEEFGEDRLKEVVTRYKGLDAKGITAKLYDELKHFTGKAPQHDDITIAVVKVSSTT